MSIDLNFTERDWERIELDWDAWWAGELERPLVAIQCLDPHVKTSLLERAPYFTSSLPLGMLAGEVIDRYQAKLEAMRYFGDAMPHWWPDFGPGIIAGFLGAQVHPRPDTVWFEPMSVGRLEELHLEYDPENAWLRRLKELTRRAVERWGRNVTIGHSDLGGNLDILAALRKTEHLLTDLHDSPDDVERLTREITRLWLLYYDEFFRIIGPAGRGTSNWAHIWSPGRTYILQSDFSFMISPPMFERYVAPDLEACCAALDHSIFHFHLDGRWQEPQLDVLLSMSGLSGIQWAFVEGWRDPQKYLPVLKRIRDGGKLCQPWGITPEAAITIVRELGGRGFLFTFDEESALSPEDARDFLRVLAGEGGFCWQADRAG